MKINAASSAIAQRWLRKAQDSITAKFKAKGDQLRTDVERTVNAMPAEEAVNRSVLHGALHTRELVESRMLFLKKNLKISLASAASS